MNGLKSYEKNQFVTPRLSKLLPELRSGIAALQEKQQQEQRFSQPNAQEEISDLVQETIEMARPTLEGDIELYKTGCRSVLEKLSQVREKNFDKYMEEHYPGFSKKRTVTFRYTLPNGEKLIQPGISTQTYISETNALQFISNNRKESLPGRLLHNKKEREGVMLTLTLNKLEYWHDRKPIMESWARGKLESKRNIEKKVLYLLGEREDFGNDDLGTKSIFSKVGDWYHAINRQKKALSDHDLHTAIDIKGRLRNGNKLPHEYDGPALRDAEDYAKELNNLYLRVNKPVSDLHKEQMMLLWTFDHKFQNFPVESQYVLRTAHEIMENGALSHKEAYEVQREQNLVRQLENAGAHLVQDEIYQSVGSIFQTEDLCLDELPTPNR